MVKELELCETFDSEENSYYYRSLINSNFVSITCKQKAGMYSINGVVNGHLKKKIEIHGKGFNTSKMIKDDRDIYLPNTDNYYIGFIKKDMIIDKILLQTDIIPLYYKGNNILDLSMDLPESDKPGRVYRLFYVKGLEMTIILMGIGNTDVVCMTLWVDKIHIYITNILDSNFIVLDRKNDLEPIMDIEYIIDRDSRICDFFRPRILKSTMKAEVIEYEYDPQGIMCGISSTQNNYVFQRDKLDTGTQETHINISYPVHIHKAFGCFLYETDEDILMAEEDILINQKGEIYYVDRSFRTFKTL